MNAWKSLWRHHSRSIWRMVLVLWMGLGFEYSLYGQTGASISGSITDLTGGALAGASVTVKNVETGAVRVITADEAGRYVASSLEVGRYEIRAEKDGFSAEVRTGITLAVGQQAVVDLTLRVGQVQDTVVVTEDIPIVSVTTRDISGLVGERQVKELPLNAQPCGLRSRDGWTVAHGRSDYDDGDNVPANSARPKTLVVKGTKRRF